MNKQRVLSGDTPTGRLHLGHWVGSLENRVALQEQYDCYFFLANMHAFSTRMDKPQEIRQSVIDIAWDFLAAGIDPELSTLFVQSEIPAIAELTFLFSMLIPFPRLMRNPTIKDEIRDKGLGDNYSFGYLLYPVGQVADILSFKSHLVPVGEDQIPHLELAREVARRFNQIYCQVDPHLEDEQHIEAGGIFPVVKPMVGRVKRLVGTGAPSEQGHLLKMSKSLNNSILLSDDADTVQRKVMNMYTDPNRLKATDPGTVENNPLWIYHETFNPNKAWVAEAEDKYRQGQIGDVACKRELVDVLNAFLQPMRDRRQHYDEQAVLDILKAGTIKANEVAETTLDEVKKTIGQGFVSRRIEFDA